MTTVPLADTFYGSRAGTGIKAQIGCIVRRYSAMSQRQCDLLLPDSSTSMAGCVEMRTDSFGKLVLVLPCAAVDML